MDEKCNKPRDQGSVLFRKLLLLGESVLQLTKTSLLGLLSTAHSSEHKSRCNRSLEELLVPQMVQIGARNESAQDQTRGVAAEFFRL